MVHWLILKPRVYKPNLIDLLLIIFVILKILSAFLGSKLPALSLPFEALLLSSFVAYFYARFFIKFDMKLWKSLACLLGALVVFESLLGFSELAIKSPLGKNLEYLLQIDYFGHAADETQFTFRSAGTFNHANALGTWVASLCIFLFVAWLENKSNILWLSFVLGFSLMLITLSRSAWLGFAVGFLLLIIYIARHNKNVLRPRFNLILKWRFLIFPVLLILFVLFVIPRAESSLYSFQQDAGAVFFRRIQILDAIEIIKLHPIFGVGAVMGVYEGIALNLYTMTASIPLVVDNWYINTALGNGLVALFVFIFFLILSLRKLFESNNNPMLKISIVNSVICLLVAGIFLSDINTEFILLLLSLTNGGNIVPANEKKNS